MDTKLPDITVCTNCGTVLNGEYCSACGQKKFNRKDLSVHHFFKDALHIFTHFDIKVFKSVLYLFTKPGFLTKEFSTGKIKSHINPITLFILLNAFFFFVGYDVFSLSDADYNNYYRQQYVASQQTFETYKQAHNLSEKDLAEKFKNINEFYRKIKYFIIIPLFAIGLKLIFIGRNKLFIEYLVQAIHTFSWYVLTLLIILLLNLFIAEGVIVSILLCIVFLYNFLSIKRIFSFKYWLTFVYTIPVSILFIYLDANFSSWLIFQLTSLHFKF